MSVCASIMSAARITSNNNNGGNGDTMERHNKIPFTLLVNNNADDDDDEDLQNREPGREFHTRKQHSSVRNGSGTGGTASGRDVAAAAAAAPKFRNIVDKFVHGNWKAKHRRYNPYSGDTYPGYKHTRLTNSVNRDGEFGEEEQQQQQRYYGNPDEIVLDGEDYLPTSPIKERSSSVERFNTDTLRGQENSEYEYVRRGEFPPSAYMGRRRSRSDTDLIETEFLARRARRAAICEEMERGILMENGITLRKCRKNLVLNQILENLSLL